MEWRSYHHMALLFLGVKTDINWIEETATVPILGGIFLFIFIPPVIISFIAQKLVPGMNNDIGFTKAMLLLLPLWLLFTWLRKIRLYCLFMPAWILFGIIAIIKAVLLIMGIDDGQ